MRILARDKELLIFEDGDRIVAANVVLEAGRDDARGESSWNDWRGK
jgi:hypothetical protein